MRLIQQFIILLLSKYYVEVQCRSVAIIGAGAAGASSAYFASQIQGVDPFDITVFESTDKVGGRARVFPIPHPYDPSQAPIQVEVGAGIFIVENQYMYNLSKLFNLTFNEVLPVFNSYLQLINIAGTSRCQPDTSYSHL